MFNLVRSLERRVTASARALFDAIAMDEPLLCGCVDGSPCADCSLADPTPFALPSWG
jgi:hypothetical protein